MSRVRRRIEPMGIGVVTVRRRGYVLRVIGAQGAADEAWLYATGGRSAS